jgi:signal transduction histidine kinase
MAARDSTAAPSRFTAAGLSPTETTNVTRLASEDDSFARVPDAAHIKRMGELARQIAHDYANLLMVISEQVSLVRGDLPTHHPAAAALRVAEQAAERARGLTQSLRAVIKGIDLQMAPLNLSQLVTDWLRTIRRGLPESIDVVADMQIDPAVVVLGDAAQLRRVLTNVATNAADAMVGGGRLTISLRERAARPSVTRGHVVDCRTEAVICVTDSGRGMSAESLSRVFDPFYSTHPHGEGAGMGMAIVREMVTAHHGRIALESAPGRGTKVSVSIPCQSRRDALDGEIAAPERENMTDTAPMPVRSESMPSNNLSCFEDDGGASRERSRVTKFQPDQHKRI